MRPRRPSGPQAALIHFAIRFRGIVIALAFILIGYGFYALLRASFDVFPEFAPPQVGIQTEAPGLTPEQVEVLITRPIENAINGVPGVEKLRSTSIQGLSVVTVFFDPAGDIGVRQRHPADHKEGRLYAFAGKDIEDVIGAGRQRAVVEGEHHLMVFERQALAVLHAAEQGMLKRVDHDGAAGAERIRIARALGGSRSSRSQQRDGHRGRLQDLHCESPAHPTDILSPQMH